MVYFSDALTLDAPRRTADGYLAVRARAARTGVYQYAGSEVDPDNKHGLRDQAVVNVLRDESTVFDERAVRSFIGKPITTDHPKEAVTSKNWKQHADGVIMGAMRDGDHLAFDLLLMDEAAINDTIAGRAELSNGYGAELQFGDYMSDDGTKCQARQDSISGNHVARVKQGRAGSSCRIGDVAVCDALPLNLLDNLKTEKPVKTMIIDGLTVDMSNADTAIATVQTLRDARDDLKTKLADADGKVVTAEATIVAKDAEIATLKQQVADSKPTPAQLRDAAKAYAQVVDKAKAHGVTVTDAMDEAAIKRAVVDKAMGDKAKDYSDEHVAIAFDVVTKDGATQRHTMPSGNPAPIVTDSRTFYDSQRAQQRADLSQAWRGTPKTEAAA
jgi:hypothetical protein